MKEDYYWELSLDDKKMKALGPKRTLDFFLENIRKARTHILELYDLDTLKNEEYITEAFCVKNDFKKDNNLEYALANILLETLKVPNQTKDHVVSSYMTDLLKRFTGNDDNFRERVYEYASFKASANHITITYGLRSKPELELSKAEAECIKDNFSVGKRILSLSNLINTAKGFYENAANTAERISRKDFYKTDPQIWENKAKTDRMIAKRYDLALELLRTMNYLLFK